MNYGVELEFVFAFHEKELDLGINEIRKNVPYEKREIYPHFSRMDPAKLPGRVYNSWGIADKRTRKLRPYATEPQGILKRHLDEHRPWIHTRVEATLLANEKKKDLYDKWLITPDHTVCGVGSDKISECLPNKQISPDGDEWDSYGLELVSPVFNSEITAGKEQIRQLLEVTVGDAKNNYGAFITKQCGVHVHVEAPKDLRVLQELSLLLVIYEETISTLHAPHRRPGHPATTDMLESNRLWWMYNDDDDFDSSTAAFAKRYTISQLRDHFRFIKSKQSLARRMCYPKKPEGPQSDRNRLVNFTYLTRGKGYPETIEFRQAAGSLDAEEISHWIDFCLDLVKFAEICVKDPERFPFKEWRMLDNGTLGTPGLLHFMHAMGHSPDGIKFWKKRAKNNYQLREKPDSLTPVPHTIIEDNNQTSPTEQPPKRKKRSTGSSAQEFEEILENHKRRRTTGITETFENGLSLDDRDVTMASPQANADRPSTIFTPQQRYNISSANFSNSTTQGGNVARSQRTIFSGGIRKTNRPKGSNSRSISSRPRFPLPSARTTKNSTISSAVPDSRNPLGNLQTPPPDSFLNNIYNALSDTSALSVSSRSSIIPTPALPELTSNNPLASHTPRETRPPWNTPQRSPTTSSITPPPDLPAQTSKNDSALPSPKEHRSPGEIAEESMSRDAFSWYVTDYDKNAWEDIQNGSFLTGRGSACGLLALSRAFKEQYPDEPYGHKKPEELLRIYDRVTPNYRPEINASDDEMQDVINLLTGGRFALVVRQFDRHDLTERARRMGDLEVQGSYARNLYLRHMPGHWEPMRRR